MNVFFATDQVKHLSLSSDASTLLASTSTTWALFKNQSQLYTQSIKEGLITGAVLIPIDADYVVVIVRDSGLLSFHKGSLCLFEFKGHSCPVKSIQLGCSLDLILLYTDNTGT